MPSFQLSLAIGKEGQNARLAARLTGWRIDIHGDEEEPPGGEWGVHLRRRRRPDRGARPLGVQRPGRDRALRRARGLGGVVAASYRWFGESVDLVAARVVRRAAGGAARAVRAAGGARHRRAGPRPRCCSVPRTPRSTRSWPWRRATWSGRRCPACARSARRGPAAASRCRSCRTTTPGAAGAPGPPAYVGHYEQCLERFADRVPAARIPVERIGGEVVLAAGEDDRLWPASTSATRSPRAVRRRAWRPRWSPTRRRTPRAAAGRDDHDRRPPGPRW